MSRRSLLLVVGLLVVPLALGTLLTLIGWLIEPDLTLVAEVPLHRLPILAALIWVVIAAPALVVHGLWTRRARREHEQLTRELTASRHRLVARLDHEIKNPLQGIRAALADEPSDRQRASIDIQSKRLMTLLRDLRKIGEVEHMPLETQLVDLPSLTREAVGATMDLPGAQSRRWEVAFPTAPRPLPPVHGDEDLLFLALLNVLGNAVKYSADGDAIEVRGQTADGMVTVEIADTGRGIPPAEQELVWEELGRAQEARGIEGSGLGLPMVRAILERHGGSATLESWHGEGTLIRLCLPAAAPVA